MKILHLKSFFTVVLIVFASLQVFSQGTGTITGTVTGVEGPLDRASITIGRLGVITNSNGEFLINVPAGRQTVTVDYVGFKQQSKTVDVKAGETINIDFQLEPGVSLNEVVIIGSRSVPRTQLSSPVPVDVIDVSQLAASSPQVNLNQMLNFAAPSFSSNTQSLGDGTDHIDPASLRGMGPDQVLVLINGKRRHNSSLINVNGTFGKGTVGTDLNAIPVSAIDRIEILRDGAAAQYGSDAIAGVINIILKKNVNHLNFSMTGGMYNSNADGNHYTDGKGTQIALDYGLPLGSKGGFINFAGSFDFRQPTNRGGIYNGTIFKNLAGQDATDSFLNATHTTRRDYSLVVGQSKISSGQFFYNSVIPVSDHAEFYSFGGLGYRDGLSSGFYRYPMDSRNVLSVYPLGFLPEIGSNIYDRSVSAGIRGDAGGWNIDFSNTYGQNQFAFRVENSLNASMLEATPTEFNAGGPKFTQNTINLDISKGFDWLAGTNLAFGAEYRFERYQILPGNEDSYTNYGSAIQVGIDGNGDPILVPDPQGPISTLFGPDGSARPGGAQVFPGFRPENAVDANRVSVAGYGDIELNFTDKFMADGAIRFENYNDFGSTLNGKLALRYKVSDQFSIRASGSTGFRAPSLQQRYYANTQTLFTDGVPHEVGVFPNNSRAAKLVGIPSLVPEKSRSVSAGVTGSTGKFRFTVDGYFTRINNRIIFTDQFAGSNDPGASEADKELYNILLLANATRAQFFANSINTNTRGVDVVITYADQLGSGRFRADLSGTFSKTKQVGDIKVSEQLQGKESIYFSNANRVYLENAVPNTKANLGLTYSIAHFDIFLRNNYFGKVTEPSNTIANQQQYGGRVITDLSVGYNFTKEVRLTIGSNNILDIYPEKIEIAANGNAGQFVYPRAAQQFGFNGRYIFARVDLNL